ncbi:TGDS, partial [Symbiodinium sp. KB8]
MEESKDASARYDKRILVTGGAGFIGSHVVLLLVKKYPNYKIINFDKLDYCSSLKNLQEIENEPNYEFIKGSINSSDLLNYVMKQASRVNKVKLFVHVSTDEVYGEGDVGEAGMGVSATLEPTNPYAASKAGAEYLVKAYHRSFKLPVIITRGNNVYGPHQYPEKIIPKFINQLARGLPCTLHGNGLNTRNYLYVKDVARAFDTILHKAKPGDVVNIGGRYEISNLTVAKTLIDIIAYSSKPGE